MKLRNTNADENQREDEQETQRNQNDEGFSCGWDPGGGGGGCHILLSTAETDGSD